METPKNITRAEYDATSNRKIVWQSFSGSGSSTCPAKFVAYEIAKMRKAGYSIIEVLPI